MTTREKVYQRLGLEVGSLLSESGRDWNEALKEVENEEKALQKTTQHKKTDLCMSEEKLKQQQAEADRINKEYWERKKNKKEGKK